MRKNLTFGAIGLLVSLLVFLVERYTNYITPFDRLLKDMNFYLREPDPEAKVPNPYVSDEIVVVGIDETSLSKIGKWPWYRQVHSEFLDRVQRFSPNLVHLDIQFTLPEEVPGPIVAQLQRRPALLSEVSASFSNLDLSFSRALQKYPNVYIDQLLRSSPILNPAPAYQRQIALNEARLREISLPLPIGTQANYSSVEPLLESFLAHAKLAVVNAEDDKDSVLRSGPLLYPYANPRGERLYIFSYVLEFLLHYYQAKKEQVRLNEGTVEIVGARVPELNPQTRQPQVVEEDFSLLLPKLAPGVVNEERYDPNLERFLVNQYRLLYPQDEDKKPDLPLRLLRIAGGQLQVIKGQEILAAARKLQSKKIDVIYYRKKTVVIPTTANETGNRNSFPINYGIREKVEKRSGAHSKGISKQYLINTKSYSELYNSSAYPDLPALDAAGRIPAGYDQAPLKNWLKQFVALKTEAIKSSLLERYGTVDQALLFDFALRENIFLGAFVFYDLYLNRFGGSLNEAEYQRFIQKFFAEREFPSTHPLLTQYLLDQTVFLSFLQAAYAEGYKNFYEKIILTGALSLGMARDVHKTPYGDMFGITVIANSLSTILTENLLQEATNETSAALLFVLSLSFAFIYGKSPIYGKYAFFAVSLLGTLLIAYYYFAEHNYLLSTAPLLFSNFLCFIILTLYSLVSEERDKKFLRDTFSDYLSPQVINNLYAAKIKPQLGGEERFITAFFTDIADFSSFTEKLQAQQTVELLNEYLSQMTYILLEERGTLDKYVGDAIVAFFGAPVEIKDGPLCAVKTALRMQERLRQLREKWRREKGEGGGRPLSEAEWKSGDKWPKMVHNMQMRIGINAGRVVVGNMGSDKRKNYTIMGDDVNLCARLESAAKQYGVGIFISEKTLNYTWEERGVRKSVKEFVETRLIDRVRVKGREQPVKLHELLAFKGELTDRQEKLRTLFHEGITAYSAMEWEKAIKKFEAAETFEAERHTAVTPSRLFKERCSLFKLNPPEKTIPVGGELVWDGIFELTKK